MKSNVQRVKRFAMGKISLVFLLLPLTIGIASVPAYSQDGIWKVDREHSIARLSLGSSLKSVEVGVARVSGSLAFNVSNAAAGPVVNLNIEPQERANYSAIAFKSKHSEITTDGKLAVVGDLSLTRVERSLTSYRGGGEGYYGPQRVATPDGSHATIALNLQLTQAVSAPAQNAGN